MRSLPPLRSPSDRDSLAAGVVDRTIDEICSDHTPLDDDEKNVPFGEAAPGSSGLEMLLALTLKWADQYSVPLSTATVSAAALPATTA